MRRATLILLSAAALLLAAPSAMSSGMKTILGAYNCKTKLTDSTVVGNVTIPKNKTCELDGTTVVGGVTGLAGSSLQAENDSKIVGNVSLSSPAWFRIDETNIVGNVQISKTSSAPLGTANRICGSSTVGAIQLTSGGVAAPSWIGKTGSCDGNDVKGPVQIMGNKAQVTVQENTILGSLSCSNNTSPPVDGSNDASSFSGQCDS